MGRCRLRKLDEASDTSQPTLSSLEVDHWEVSQSYTLDKNYSSSTEPDSDDASSISSFLSNPSGRGTFSYLRLPPTSPPVTDIFVTSPRSIGTDDESWASFDPEGFFYPEDLLGEQLLPEKLPWALVQDTPRRGNEMRAMAKLVHAKLNEVAGLQVKAYELTEFALAKREEWEADWAAIRGAFFLLCFESQ